METLAVVMEGPGRLALRALAMTDMAADAVMVDIAWSGISTGTEKLLWTGRMPAFPGMGYPLVPGYESVGRVVDAGADARALIGAFVFVPGASCYRDARGLFGGAARRLVVPAQRVVPIDDRLGEQGVLLALAATAWHAIAPGLPDLIVGHGVLGRLAARLAVAHGGRPLVWETDPERQGGARGYAVVDPAADAAGGRSSILDMSGDPTLLDTLIARLAKGGEVVLAGFYDRPLAFDFAPAFRAEARIRVAAEFTPDDLQAVRAMIADGRLRLDGLVSHVRPAAQALEAYPQAFEDRSCLKMVLDWREAA